MQLAIPRAPRPVRFTQVPGTVGRLLKVLLAGGALMALLGVGAWVAGRLFVEERGFLDRAQELEGLVATVSLPPREKRAGAEGALSVLYRFQDLQRTASGVRVAAEVAEGLGPGARIRLLVDPTRPDLPREAGFVRERAGRWNLLPWALGLGGLLTVGLFAWVLRRTVRAEVQPLRTGMLVWLTPDGPLPERGDIFPATYWQQDVKHAVRARLRPGQAPVRNGDKLLAAVLPHHPGLARVVDEELARILGWVR
ncbi:DUF3592 domain-containing protein [Myxococcaceae bacterium GXIMD 01537]